MTASTGKRSFQNKTTVQYINFNKDDHYIQHVSFIQIMKVNISRTISVDAYSAKAVTMSFSNIFKFLFWTLSSGRKGWNLKVINFLEQIMLISLPPNPMTQSAALYGLHLIDANRLSVAVPTVVGGTAANSYQKSIF